MDGDKLQNVYFSYEALMDQEASKSGKASGVRKSKSGERFRKPAGGVDRLVDRKWGTTYGRSLAFYGRPSEALLERLLGIFGFKACQLSLRFF